MTPPCDDAIDRGDQAAQNDRQSHPLVRGGGAFVDPLCFGGCGEAVCQDRIAGQKCPGFFQPLLSGLGVGGELLQITVRLLLRFLGETMFRLYAVGWNVGTETAQVIQKAVYIFFPLEGALLLCSVAIFHHQIGNGAKKAAAGKAALAHGHPFKDPAHIL